MYKIKLIETLPMHLFCVVFGVEFPECQLQEEALLGFLLACLMISWRACFMGKVALGQPCHADPLRVGNPRRLGEVCMSWRKGASAPPSLQWSGLHKHPGSSEILEFMGLA